MLTLVLSKDGVVSVNSVLTIPVGTEIDIVNESYFYDVYIVESDTQPPFSRDGKRSITQRDGEDASVYIPLGAKEVWVYSPHGSTTLSVQVL